MNQGEPFKIQGAVAFVTGANRGIGRAFVAALLERGAKRVYAAARDPKTLDAVVALDQARVSAIRLDIVDSQQIRDAITRIRDVNLLINNAGVAAFSSLLSGSAELVERDMATNYFGTLNLTRAVVPIIERTGGGAIVNLLSIVALGSFPALGGYSASKAASNSMTQAIRAELASRNIRVHGVFPGPVDTDMARGLDMPKSSPGDVATAVLDDVEAGREDIFPDPMSAAVAAQWAVDPNAVVRQFGINGTRSESTSSG
jgi:NAD(P)-dependent dehydrogenase (short-subunit alcohol dehydrogenase family)